ncbi:MAG: hypothetical protein R2753_06300 [Chitinophagales bacterium]
MKISPYYLLLFLLVTLFNSCEDPIVRPDDVLSPYFLELNEGGKLVNLRHKADGEQASTNTSNNSGICNWLYNDCNKNNSDDTLYFASSLGNAQFGYFNFIFTNLPYDEDLSVDNTLSLAALLENLPRNEEGEAEFVKGAINEGISSGNVYIGKPSYKYGYTIAQNSSKIEILDIKDGVFNGQPVAIVSFNFAYTIANENAIDAPTGNSIQISKGSGCLPFGLHGSN